MGKLTSIWFIECIVNLYDIVTLPLYYLIQQPWKSRQAAHRTRAIQVGEFVWVNVDSKLVNEKKNRKPVATLDELFRDSVATFATKDCLGVRKVIGVEYKEASNQNGGITKVNGLRQPGKREIKNLILDDKYTWYSFSQVEQTVIKLSAALTNICDDSITSPDGSRKILICADTCIQWFLTAHACFRNNITVVTAYTNLDDSAILTTINESETKVLVVSQNFAHRVPRILEKAPLVDTIIILDEPLPGVEDEGNNLRDLLSRGNIKRLISYNKLLEQGANMKENILSVPKKEDIAVLMYTSGSTGKAKGVMLTHHSIVYTSLSFSGPGDINPEDRYIGYLPLGHVLELAAECIFLRNGSTIAYSSPFTLTDQSSMIKKGQKGDASLFKPTIMGAVPLVLDRIKNSLQQAIKSRGPFYDQLINDFVVRYKRYWWERYYDTPVMNLLLCRQFKNILGGHLRAICSGGAALSKETQEYLRHVTATVVIQGYGLTETSAAASFSDVLDRRYNVVGPPYPTVQLKLESWSDYTVHDKPYPRGEIIIGGQPVSAGYYRMDDLTKEHFYTDPETGTRYFRTGDIGLMLPDGVLKIIDRKKDIVKPLSGEYISLSAIESALIGCPVVENILIYCSQYSNYIVAIVRPNSKELRSLAIQLFCDANESGNEFRESIMKAFIAESGDIDPKDGRPETVEKIAHFFQSISLETLCSNKILIAKTLELIQDAARRNKLKRTQTPIKIKLATEEWNQESGLVTASFKLRRREIEKCYSDDIKQLYLELGQKIDQNN